MSEKMIPEYIDPFRFAEQNLVLDGIVKVADLKRLQTSLKSLDEVIAVHLAFGVDEQGITFIKGHLATKLLLQCQRCMEPVSYEIMSDFILGIVNKLDEVNALPERYEPALAKDNSLALRDLIEDEIILNLPIIPRHEPSVCKVELPLTNADWDESKKNPFHVLESLKDKRK